MEEHDVRFLTASYKIFNEGPQIELYGRTREGKSIVVLHRGFFPYFYYVGPVEDVKRGLYGDTNVISIDAAELLVDGKKKECAKVTVKIPRTVPEYRSRLPMRTLASDIPFHFRFLYDRDIGSCMTVSGDRAKPDQVRQYHTDIVLRARKYTECEAFRPKLRILSFDIENSIKKNTIFCICFAIRDTDGSIKYETLEGREQDIITWFSDTINKWDPDIITGYNIDGYDIPKIIDRGKIHGINEMRIGRDGGNISSVNNRFWRLRGRIVADAWWNAKREKAPKQETLAYVSQMLLGESKHDVDPRKMDEEWAADKDKVIRYCKKDAELALRILEEIHIVEKFMDLGTVSKLPLDDVLNGRTSNFIDSILIRVADRKGIGVPTTRRDEKTEKIEGGYVHAIKPDLYHWVCVLDFKSMYPSIIIDKNICFTTMTEDEASALPFGVRFMKKSERKGLLPNILEGMMKQRDSIKAEMKSTKDEERREYLDSLQAAVKILMNSFYGVFASAFYRFTDQRIGASITAFARDNIKTVIKSLEDSGYTVIYSDTDSVFFLSPDPSVEASLKHGKTVSEKFSQGSISLEFEKIIEPLFSHGKKKRYVGMVVWPKEEMIVRGYEMRRTDSFEFQSRSLSNVFKKLLAGDTEGCVRLARELIAQLKAGDVSIADLVISRTVKEESAYKSPHSLPHFIVANRLKEMGYEIVPGMKVSWIVTNSKTSPQGVEPFVQGQEFKGKPDTEYYARRVASTLARALEVFGWDERALLQGTKQAGLFDSYSDGDDVPDTISGEDTKSKKKRGKSISDTNSAPEKKKGNRLEDFF